MVSGMSKCGERCVRIGGGGLLTVCRALAELVAEIVGGAAVAILPTSLRGIARASKIPAETPRANTDTYTICQPDQYLKTK